jgi:sugar-specific transcriptional regulator TrmB
MKNDKFSSLELLLQLGLSEQEAVVYTTLLQLEAVSIRKVAAQANINRGNV